jgi:hypothetical protein
MICRKVGVAGMAVRERGRGVASKLLAICGWSIWLNT